MIGQRPLEPVLRRLGLLLVGAVARRGGAQQVRAQRAPSRVASSAAVSPAHAHGLVVWASSQRATSCGAAARSAAAANLAGHRTRQHPHLSLSGPVPGAAVGGGYALAPRRPSPVPRLAWDRFASMAEVMRLLHVVGSARNLFAVFFLGDVEQVAGPVSLAVMGSPGAPLPAGEAAALVARLNAVPAAERQRLRISLFARAPQEEIDRLLTEPGAVGIVVERPLICCYRLRFLIIKRLNYLEMIRQGYADIALRSGRSATRQSWCRRRPSALTAGSHVELRAR